MIVCNTARSNFVPVCISGVEARHIVSKMQHKVVIRNRMHITAIKIDYSEKMPDKTQI